MHSTGFNRPVRNLRGRGRMASAAVLFGYSARTPDGRRNLLQFSIIAFVIAALGTRAFMTGRGM